MELLGLYVIVVFDGQKQRLRHGFSVWLRQISHARWQHFWNASYVSADNQEAARRSFQIGDAEGFC